MPYELLAVKEMIAAEQAAIKSGIPAYALMEKAGEALAKETAARFSGKKIWILAGPGNNGGDGWVAARYLQQMGRKTHVASLVAPQSLKGEAAQAAKHYSGSSEILSERTTLDADVVIDALFGTGLSKPLEGIARKILEVAEAKSIPIVAADIPSGIQGDSGEMLGFAPHAALTVTFFRKKLGHRLLPGKGRCGEIIVADIGIEPQHLVSSAAMENTPELWKHAIRMPSAEDHKYTRGHAVIAGGSAMPGAAKLAALAAARSGAGLTSILCAQEAFAVYAASLLSIMVKPESQLDSLLNDVRPSAFLIGPGKGVGDATKRQTLQLLDSQKPVVLDADALTVLAGSLPALHGPCVMTPHEGEFARIFSYSGSKLERAQAAAKESGAVVILKGSDTVIASPCGRAAIQADAPSWLATAGAGDILAGTVTGLLAQAMPPFEAGCMAVWMQATAARRFGPGMMAEDLPGIFPELLRGFYGERTGA